MECYLIAYIGILRLSLIVVADGELDLKKHLISSSKCRSQSHLAPYITEKVINSSLTQLKLKI